ncbi:sensor histidine kinase [Paenibacillus eucommiae]|uniref:Two-component system sensor histidine kinase YesM n=1 Tax=Paenibacillus eucommiae TaxID=1355755 RepID=A0ABS4IR96_9BACL|nr:histidine kinase [Paenibacillus eucommiae]MBP1990093.1 two-component system sensor histidine kinase YesM [Paenibacillus eucommiae]
MKVNIRVGSSSIFRKIFITFLILLVPLYCITLIFVVQEEDRLRGYLTSSLENRISQQMQAFETEVNRIMRFQMEYAVDEDLLQLSTISEGLTPFQRSQAVLDLQRRLYLLKESSPFIAETIAMIPSIKGSVVSKTFELRVDMALWKGLRSEGQMVGPFNYWDNGLYLTLTHPRISLGSNKEPSFLLVVKMNKPTIEKMISDLHIYPDSQSLLISLETGLVLSGNEAVWQMSDADSKLALQRKLRLAEEADVINGNWEVGSNTYFVSAAKSDELGVMLITYVPNEQVLGPTKVYLLWFWSILALSFVIVLLFSLSIYRFIHRPLLKLVSAFRQVERGEIHAVIDVNHSVNNEFGYLYNRFNLMVNELRNLIEEVYEQRIRSQQSELKRLQSQINPHFLYNSLFVLYQLIELNDNANALRFAKYLGEFFRYITRDSKEEVVLSRELEQAKAYTEIQKICYGHRLQVEFGELLEQAGNPVVPRIIIQPVIENAFKYAFEHKVTGGKLSVQFKVDGDLCVIVVQDNGEKLDDRLLQRLQKETSDDYADPMELSGLINVHRRLRIRYGEPCGLRFSRSGWGGLCVEIIIQREKEC